MKNVNKFFKPFFVFVFILFFQAINPLEVFGSEITFTAIADTHIKSDKANNSMTPSIEKLLRAKDDINSSGSKFAVFLGDNIDKADKYDLVMFAKIINKIKKPVYVGIGNHDILKTQGLTKKEYYKLLNRFSKNKISKLPAIKKVDEFIFIFMDGTNETIPMPRGYFRDSEMIFLEKALNKYEDKNVVIFQHFPILPPKEGTLRQTFKDEPYKKILSEHKNVKMIVSGHYHMDFEGEDENGIKHISIPSLAKDGEYKVINIKTLNDRILVKTKIINVE